MEMSIATIPQKNRSRKPNRELTIAPRAEAESARHFLAGVSRLLDYASQSPDPQEVIGGLTLCRKLPGMVARLEGEFRQ
jgi:hypothetical protein